MATLADLWKSYREEVLGQWDNEEVVLAFRVAFYAGAHSVRMIQQEVGEPLDEELEAFELEVKEAFSQRQ